MEISKDYTQKIQGRKGANNKHADLVFSYFKKWDTSMNNEWGKKITGRMMRDAKKYGRGFVEKKMGDTDEKLKYMKDYFPKKFKAIMENNTTKQKYFWNKFMK